MLEFHLISRKEVLLGVLFTLNLMLKLRDILAPPLIFVCFKLKQTFDYNGIHYSDAEA